jgi:predicted ribosomally synthesized peptide with SipW-like signal peptide
MKRIILSSFIILGVASIVAGATKSFFSDTETSQNNTIQTGTVDIDVDGQNPWTGKYEFANIEPGTSRDINFTIHNVGDYPVNVWKQIANLTTTTGIQSQPECIAENGTWNESAKTCTGITAQDNEIDKVTDYSLKVELYRNSDCSGGSFWDQTIYNGNYTVFQIKDTDMILGMIPKGDCMKVYQTYKFKPTAGNQYQGDQMAFNINVIAEQLTGTAVLENKNNSYLIQHDGKQAILNYTLKGPEFGYNLKGEGLEHTNYSLIYYADGYPGNHPGAFIGEGAVDSSGKLEMSGKIDIGISLPSSPDTNSPDGAKIWLVPSSGYDKNSKSIVSWDTTAYLWETGLIQYERTTSGSTSIPGDPTMPEAPESDPPVTPTSSQTISLNELGGDVANQYGYNINYSNANVSFAYTTPASNKLTGTITASGLKPYATYQVKFIGKPTCAGSGNDTANEYIGYKGRWTVTNVACSGAGCNRTDIEYEASKSNSECVAGYLVWDFFTADSNGNATELVQTANSYHVLFAGGGACNVSSNNPLYLKQGVDSNHSDVYFVTSPDKVDGQIERGTCGGLTLDPGDYNLKMVLTEESFHTTNAGTWATVLQKDINFKIN